MARLEDRLKKSPDEAGPLVEDLGALVAAATLTVRGFVSTLRPRILEDLGLVAAAEWLCDSCRRASGLDCTLELQPDFEAVDPDTGLVVFRVLQEATTNALKHASAARIALRLRREGDVLVAEVADDDLILDIGPRTAAKLAELKVQPGFASTFLSNGQSPAAGSVFLQPKLAATLDHIAHAGTDDFYRGDLARSMARELEQMGSPLRLADLQRHHAKLIDPLTLQHSQGRVHNMTPPTQGLMSLIILGLLDRLSLGQYPVDGADHVHLCVEATKQAFKVRDQHLTDPAYMTRDPAEFLTAAALDAMARKIDPQQALPWGAGRPPADTIWMGVVDEQGLCVSFIQSIYHEFGSGIVLPTAGVNWQNRGCSFSLDPKALNTLEPLRKPFHTLNPALAVLDSGRTMVYGTMGGDGQPQTQAAIFSRVVHYGLDPQDAISRPRWLLGRTWGQTSDTLKLESRFPDAVTDELRRRGHDVEIIGALDETVGHAGCIVREANGILKGGWDPRSDGAVVAY
mgnify:CR=1 FL=1